MDKHEWTRLTKGLRRPGCVVLHGHAGNEGLEMLKKAARAVGARPYTISSPAQIVGATLVPTVWTCHFDDLRPALKTQWYTYLKRPCTNVTLVLLVLTPPRSLGLLDHVITVRMAPISIDQTKYKKRGLPVVTDSFARTFTSGVQQWSRKQRSGQALRDQFGDTVVPTLHAAMTTAADDLDAAMLASDVDCLMYQVLGELCSTLLDLAPKRKVLNYRDQQACRLRPRQPLRRYPAIKALLDRSAEQRGSLLTTREAYELLGVVGQITPNLRSMWPKRWQGLGEKSLDRLAASVESHLA